MTSNIYSYIYIKIYYTDINNKNLFTTSDNVGEKILKWNHQTNGDSANVWMCATDETKDHDRSNLCNRSNAAHYDDSKKNNYNNMNTNWMLLKVALVGVTISSLVVFDAKLTKKNEKMKRDHKKDVFWRRRTWTHCNIWLYHSKWEKSED